MKLSFITKIGVFLICLFLASAAKATEYYVDANTSSSTQNGAQATPWKTIAQVNSKMGSFQPGDIIYFKKGGIFTGPLTISKSGSASAPLTFSTYGTGTKPVITGSGSTLVSMYQRQYVVLDGFIITDLNMDPNDHYAQAVAQRGVEVEGSYLTVKNCEISLVGCGINLTGSNCTIDNNKIFNLRMIRNTPVSQNADDDYGASPIVVSGGNNNITSNYFKDCWAYSYDYGFDGGGVEFYGDAASNNNIMYNTAIDCNGFMEYGSSEGGESSNNVVAYNLLINCGDLVYNNSSGQYAISVKNLQVYNNIFVETVVQFTGVGQMIILGSNSTIVMKNNIFWLTSGVDVAKSGVFNLAQNVHEDNIYHLGTGSVLNFTANTSELSTLVPLFNSTAGSDPGAWNYNPLASSPAIDFGQNVGMVRDFAGTSVSGNNTPNAGILEGTAAVPAPLAATSTGPAIACNGGNTTVTVAATGGTAPYTGTGTFTKTAGTFSFTVTDAAGQTATTSITIAEPVALTSTLTAGTIAVFGGTTSVTVVAAGGTSPYTYSINNGTYQTSNIFTNVAAGTYAVSVKDSKGCIISKNITITQPAAPPTLTTTATAGTISCNGAGTTVTVTATGGTAPYTGTGTFTKTAGTYSFTVTDAGGQTATTSVTITEPAAITSTVTAGNITVFGGSTTITATAGGGTAPYTYRINNGTYQTGNSFTNIVAGTYAITARDANGCTIVKNIVLTQPAAIPTLVATAAAGTISCNGGTTTVTVIATGGTSPYTGTGTFTKAAGTYSFTVTDAGGQSSAANVTITEPAALTSIITAGTIAVNGGTTTITATAGGGTAPYTYRLNNGTYQAANTFTNIAAGTYSVTVKDTNGCTIAKNITITQPAAIPALSATATAGTIGCNGGTTTVTVTATGGTSPYAGTGTFTKAAGTYSFTVTDAGGQSSAANVTITEPAALTSILTAGTIAVNGGTTTITATAGGGTAPYTYRLNNGTYQAANTFTNIAAGTYSVTVKDANGCTIAKNITITQPAAIPALSATATAGTIGCNGGTTTVTVTATGGTAPYTGTGTFTKTAGTYSFTVTDAGGQSVTASITVAEPTALTSTVTAGTITVNGGTTTITATAGGGTAAYTYSLNNGTYQTANTFTNIGAGTYSVTVKDANGCTITKNIAITQPAPIPPLTAAASVTAAITCNGGSATINVAATGGTAPYTGTGNFTRTAGTYTFTVTDANGVTNDIAIAVTEPTALNATVTSGTITVNGGTTTITVATTGGTAPYTYKLNNGAYQSSNTFTNITAGSYTITVKDANGCTITRSRTISQPGAPPTLVAQATAGTIACNGGTTTVTVTATGGSGNYTGTGTFTKAAGTYTFIVTDAAGTTADVIITVAQPSAINVTVVTGNITVYGGSTTATVTATGGTPAFTYSYDNGAFQAGNVFSNVVAGTHTIKVKDSRGCISTKSITVTQPAQVPALVATATAGTISCYGESTNITVAATGGVAPYTGTGTFTKSAGTYTFTVTDVNGTTGNVTIIVAQPTAIDATVTTGTITVNGGSTTAIVTATGGTPAYTYSYDNGAYQSAATFTNVTAGAHNIRIKDSKGCIATKAFAVTQPAATPSLVATASAGTISCNGGTATVTIAATGGTVPYAGTGTFTKAAGSYSFTVTDANGATSTVSVTIAQPSAINVTVTTGLISLNGGITTATVAATGGTPAYTYSIDNGNYQSSNIFSNLAAGDHRVVVKDSKGCTSVKLFNIAQPEVITALTLLVNTGGTTCRGSNSGVIVASASGGKGAYSYRLDNGPFVSTNTFANLAAGTYTVTVRDSMQSLVSTRAVVVETRRRCNAIGLTVMGNPTITDFKVKIETESTEPISVTVMNLNGQRVYQSIGKANDINTFGRDFTQGIYILKVMQGTQIETLRLIKGR